MYRIESWVPTSDKKMIFDEFYVKITRLHVVILMDPFESST